MATDDGSRRIDGGMQPKPAIFALSRACIERGTGSSNPSPSSRESTNYRLLLLRRDYEGPTLRDQIWNPSTTLLAELDKRHPVGPDRRPAALGEEILASR